MSTKDVDLRARVEPAEKQRFEARAKRLKVKPSELLRRLIRREIGLDVDAPLVPQSPNPRRLKVEATTVRLPGFMKDVARARAEQKGMSVGRWMASQLQASLTGQPVMTDKELLALNAMNRELLAIGRNVNQIAKALNMSINGIERSRVSLDALDKLPATIDLSRKVIRTLIRASQQSWVVSDDE